MLIYIHTKDEHLTPNTARALPLQVFGKLSVLLPYRLFSSRKSIYISTAKGFAPWIRAWDYKNPKFNHNPESSSSKLHFSYAYLKRDYLKMSEGRHVVPGCGAWHTVLRAPWWVPGHTWLVPGLAHG